jgi:curved DNA-binding protein CbpA
MNGQLSEQPLAELIREISIKSLSGRLRLEQERVKVVAYFDSGSFLFAASNVRTFRVREYLKKAELVSDQDLAQFNERTADTDLIKVLRAQNLLSAANAQQIQTRQVTDVMRLPLLWTDGAWDFDSRSRLEETPDLKIDVNTLLLEAARRLPAEFAGSRFRNPAEMLMPSEQLAGHENLLPAEVFLLSRLDQPLALRDLIAISGLSEAETLQIVYSLTLAGLVKREHWKSSFRDQQPTPPAAKEEPAPIAPPVAEPPSSHETDLQEVENFLVRIKNAKTHYEVLDVSHEASPAELKNVYYQFARRYHPDRFRKTDAALVVRIESAFARITNAYDTLRDDKLRSGYNAKLEARKKAEKLAEPTPKTSPEPEPKVETIAEQVISVAERAETQYKEGLAALELGQRKIALGLFASAASAKPKEARYRASYGQMLAASEHTRRTAETELLAAIKLEPANADYRIILAELYRDLGLKLRAKGEAERAVAADPNNRKARELLRALK